MMVDGRFILDIEACFVFILLTMEKELYNNSTKLDYVCANFQYFVKYTAGLPKYPRTDYLNLWSIISKFYIQVYDIVS